MLTRSKILSAFRFICCSIFLVMPITYINHIYNCCSFLIGENRILHILCCTQCDSFSSFVFIFLLINHITPKLNKMQRASEFSTNFLDHTCVVFKVIEALPDECPMQFVSRGISCVIELLGHEEALVASVRNRFGKASAINIVCCSPRKVG